MGRELVIKKIKSDAGKAIVGGGIVGVLFLLFAFVF